MKSVNTLARVTVACLAAAFSQTALAVPPDPNPEAHALQRDGKHAEAAAKLETYLEHNRFDGQAWSDYGFALHSDKHYEKAIIAFEKAAALGLSPELQYYNIACANALLGRKDPAFTYLRKALEARFADQDTLRTDTDMDPLRADPRFFDLTGLNGPTPDGLSREKQWAWDLAFLQRRMEQMHWDLYSKISKAAFSAEITALTSDAARLTDNQIRARLMKLLALVGDGHTMLAGARDGEENVQRFPLHMFLFSDGLYIIGAPTEYTELVGARVLSFGPIAAAADAVEAIRPYCSVDNSMGYLAKAPVLLANPTIVQAIGGASDESAVELRVRTAGPSGTEKTVHVTPAPYPAKGRNNGAIIPGFTYVHNSAPSPLPLWLREPARKLRTENLPESKTLYCWFGTVQNDGPAKLGEFFNSMFEFISKNDVENLVIDMRLNGGGNTGLVQPLIHGLIKCDKIDRPGHLFVIIGRHTFSAAQNTASMIEANTNATFVGEPTGSCPNFVGESTWFLLPYSQLRVHCSSRYWQNAFSTDRRTWVQPQLAVEMSFADYAANRDPCMDAILARIDKPDSSR